MNSPCPIPPTPHRATARANHAIAAIALAIASLVLGAGCVAAGPQSDRPAKIKRLSSAHSIPDEVAWQRLAARPEAASIARTEVVKFLLDLEAGRKLWFTDTERYPFHYDFARDRLQPVEDHALFNEFEYEHANRRFEMGTIIHYLDPDIWALELVSSDTLSGERIVRLFEQVRAALWVGDRLRFHPLSDLHEQSIAPVRDRLPVTTTEEVFLGIRYQPLTTGITFGYLRLVRGPLEPATVRADQIVVLETLPEEIPVSAGVVSQQLQAPLGHIAILCATRRTPNMALRDVLEHADFQRLDGQLVALEVGPQDFSLRAATLAEAESDWSKRRPARPQVPRLDPDVTGLVDVTALRLNDTRFAGAKAAQLGEVARLKNIRTPGGFVIPVSHYLHHLSRTGAAADLPAQLADATFARDAAGRTRWLANVRATIERTAIDAQLVRDVHQRMQAIAPESRWILRSSTNAEDLAGFTGAGLYRSIRVQAGASEADLAAAIREVWASVWLPAAFEERAWYRVDHAAVAMAILVQPFVDGAVANGVAITANPFAEMRPAFFINAQSLGGSVTGAAGNEIPEQQLVYTFMGDFEAEILSRSSRTGGERLLGDPEIRALSAVLQRLHRHFVPRWRGTANAVDVEFLIAGEDRHVVILQARPYTVTYTKGQRMEDVTSGSGDLRFPGIRRY